jgi:hypothetical protein
MRINRGLLGWAVFLVLVGAIPLLVRGGYISEDQIRNLGSLWPLILIGVGIAVLFGRTRFAFVGGLLVAATFGVIVGGLLSGGVAGIGLSACGPGADAVAFPPQSGTFDGSTARVDLVRNCGETTITMVPGAGWRVEGEDRDGAGPRIDAQTDSLTVQSRDDDRGPLGLVGQRERWRITLPDSVRLDLEMNLNAGNATINLTGGSLNRIELDLNAGATVMDLGSVKEIGELRVAVNAGSLDLILPSQSMSGSIDANAGSVNLCAPSGAGLKLNATDSIVASYDYEDHGLVKTGSTWQTPGYESAAVQIELDTRASAGSFSLDPEDGCGG